MAGGYLCERINQMTKDERESIITQLALVEGVNRSVFEKYTDEQLINEMRSVYGENDKN
jgi:hypothetical protein